MLFPGQHGLSARLLHSAGIRNLRGTHCPQYRGRDNVRLCAERARTLEAVCEFAVTAVSTSYVP